MIDDPEGEEFNHVEMMSRIRQEVTNNLPTKTTAYWHERFVEIKNPHKENEVVRFYFDPLDTRDNVFEELAKAMREFATDQRDIEAKLKEKNNGL